MTWAFVCLPANFSLPFVACVQACVFKVDYTVEQLQGREFGSVFLNQSDNVALAVATAGWAKVRTLTGADANNAKKQSPYMEVSDREGWGQAGRQPASIMNLHANMNAYACARLASTTAPA